ncbi:MAG: dolichyl-phosphate beta-glucosyltransferase [Candidatus Aquicultorales bacterium]
MPMVDSARLEPIDNTDGVFLSVVIPAFNEANRVGASLQRIHEYLSRSDRSFEVIVVSDGSTDATDFLIKRMARELGGIVCISYKKNRGKGFAVKQGILASKGRYVLICDADLSTPIEELENLLPHCEGSVDVAFGSRALPESHLDVDQTVLRHLMGRIFNAIVRAVALPGVRDSQCGFKCIKGEVARQLFSTMTTDGFAFDVELLVRAKKSGYHICEIPIRWLDKPSSTVRPFSDSISMLADVIRVSRSLR